MTNAAQNHTQSPEMQAVCTKLKELDAHGKRLVSLVLEEEYIRCRALQQEQRKPMRIIRSSLYRVSAGTGIFLDDDTAWEEI